MPALPAPALQAGVLLSVCYSYYAAADGCNAPVTINAPSGSLAPEAQSAAAICFFPCCFTWSSSSGSVASYPRPHVFDNLIMPGQASADHQTYPDGHGQQWFDAPSAPCASVSVRLWSKHLMHRAPACRHGSACQQQKQAHQTGSGIIRMYLGGRFKRPFMLFSQSQMAVCYALQSCTQKVQAVFGQPAKQFAGCF